MPLHQYFLAVSCDYVTVRDSVVAVRYTVHMTSVVHGTNTLCTSLEMTRLPLAFHVTVVINPFKFGHVRFFLVALVKFGRVRFFILPPG